MKEGALRIQPACSHPTHGANFAHTTGVSPHQRANASRTIPCRLLIELPLRKTALRLFFMYAILPPMIVSMLQVIFEIPDVDTIKAKRRIVQSVKMKLQKRFHLSAAEIDLQDALSFSQIGAVMASNSKRFGEAVMRKAFEMIENETPVRIHDMAIHSEEF
jgi:uncharacterized protein YlxP (DUF503 family)